MGKGVVRYIDFKTKEGVRIDKGGVRIDFKAKEGVRIDFKAKEGSAPQGMFHARGKPPIAWLAHKGMGDPDRVCL